MASTLRLLSACGLALGLAAAVPAFGAESRYLLDKTHMDVAWSISHAGFSISHGRFRDLNASLVLDPAKPAASRVEAQIQTDSLDSGSADRDTHLKGADFFDVAKYPDIRFVSTKVTPTGAMTAKVEGNLTLHGVTRPVTLDATIVKLGLHPMRKKDAAGVHATTTIKRSDFGMTSSIPLVGDEVAITLDAEFVAAS